MSNVQPEGEKTLDHLYPPHTDTYKSLPHPPSDHNSSLLIPAYKQKIKQEPPVTQSVRKWSDEADAKLPDCFASTDWNMLPGFFLWHCTPHQTMVSSISATMTSSPQ